MGYVEMADTVLAFPLVCYTRHARGALRDDTKNGCVADYYTIAGYLTPGYPF